MDSQELLTIVKAFSDSPDDVIYDRNQIAFELQNSTIAITIEHSMDGILINDGQERLLAQRWVIDKLAQLPILARRIQSHFDKSEPFIEPACFLERNYSLESPDLTGELPDALSAARAWCNNQYAYASRVLYLTSDAGEGKTTCINALATLQADKFLQRQSHWLLLPVSLGGRPFLRLDEVIIAALSQVFRFQRLYFEAFVELVRMGVIVLALDGFEEMFVEGHAGDAVSALGNLLSLLRSRGTVVIAARKAYFDYKSIDTQSKLFDSLRSVDVEFARLHLARWDKTRFLKYASAQSVADPQRLYSLWRARVGSDDHPLLCRPVLVKHLVKLGTPAAPDDEGEKFGGVAPEQYYEPFVREIIEREANQKWLNFSDEPATQLLTVKQHFDLLATVAREMWLAESEIVGGDVLDFAAEDFCESARLSPGVTRQVVERLKQHALVGSTTDKRRFHFDHEEFFQFFLGYAVATQCRTLDAASVGRMLRDRPLPIMALEMAAAQVRGIDGGPSVVPLLSELCEVEQGYSALRENCGNLMVLILQERSHAAAVLVKRAAVTHGLLGGRSFQRVVFENCFFGPMELKHSHFRECEFRHSNFQEIDVYPTTVVEATRLVECDVDNAAMYLAEDVSEAASAYAPDDIWRILRRAGFEIGMAAATSECPADVSSPTTDDRLRVFRRFLRIYSRATGVSDNVVRQRLGVEATMFFDDVLERVLAAGVVVEVEWKGGGTQRRFRLGVPMNEIQTALERSNGEFDRFISTFT